MEKYTHLYNDDHFIGKIKYDVRILYCIINYMIFFIRPSEFSKLISSPPPSLNCKYNLTTIIRLKKNVNNETVLSVK